MPRRELQLARRQHAAQRRVTGGEPGRRWRNVGVRAAVRRTANVYYRKYAAITAGRTPAEVKCRRCVRACGAAGPLRTSHVIAVVWRSGEPRTAVAGLRGCEEQARSGGYELGKAGYSLVISEDYD